MKQLTTEPAIWFRRVDQPVSNSRLGGLPSLPPGIEWPLQEQKQAPFHFLAQLDLAALPATPIPGSAHSATLPRDGMLFFFTGLAKENLFYFNGADQNLKRCWAANSKVIYAPSAGSDRPVPHDLPLQAYHQVVLGIEQKVFPGAHLRAYIIDSYPNPGLETLQMSVRSIEKATGEPAPDLDTTTKPHLLPPYCRSGPNPYNAHFDALQMFGYPLIHHSEGKSAIAEGRHLLFQMPGHTLGMDDSTLQFWIMPDDLAARRFDKAWGTQEHM